MEILTWCNSANLQFFEVCVEEVLPAESLLIICTSEV